MTLIQSPPCQYAHTANETKAITVSGRTYHFIPGHAIKVLPEDAAFIVANISGWTMAGPVDGSSSGHAPLQTPRVGPCAASDLRAFHGSDRRGQALLLEKWPPS
jgi:hypothetical protein